MCWNCSQTLIRLLRSHLPRGEGNPLRRGCGRTGSGAPTGAAENRGLYRCTETAPRPSSVCFADTFPGGEGNPLRRGRAVLHGKFMNIRLYIHEKYDIVVGHNGAVS